MLVLTQTTMFSRGRGCVSQKRSQRQVVAAAAETASTAAEVVSAVVEPASVGKICGHGQLWAAASGKLAPPLAERPLPGHQTQSLPPYLAGVFRRLCRMGRAVGPNQNCEVPPKVVAAAAKGGSQR